MKRLILVLQLISLGFYGMAQNKQLTMIDAMTNARTLLSPENMSQIQFIYGTEDYVYAKRVGNAPVWYRGNFKSQSEQPFLSLGQLNAKLAASGLDTLNNMVLVQFNQGANWVLSVGKGKSHLIL